MKEKEKMKSMAAALFASGSITFLLLSILTSLGAGWSILIAVFVGAMVGYFGYNFQAVLRAIPLALKKAAPVLFHLLKWVYGKFAKPSLMTLFLVIPTIIGFFLGLVCPFLDFGEPRLFVALLVADATAISSLFVLFIFVITFIFGVNQNREERWKKRLDVEDINKVVDVLMFKGVDWIWMLLFLKDLLINNLNLFFIIPWAVLKSISAYSPKALRFLLLTCPKCFFFTIPCAIGRFFKILFLLIHNDIRLICGIDGPIGGLATYSLIRLTSDLSVFSPLAQLGLTILGGIVAICLGLLNYKLISIKLLKLNPEAKKIGLNENE